MINGKSVDYMSLIIRLITGKAIGPFYYIIVLFLLTCISPLLEGIVYKRDRKTYRIIDVLFLSITPAYAAIIYWMMANNGNAFSDYTMLLPAWILFYYVGIRMRILSYRPNKRFWMAIMLIGLFASITESLLYWKSGIDIEFVISQLKASSICYTLAISMLFYVLWTEGKDYKPKRITGKVLLWFGDHSYIVYLSHWVIILLANKIFSKFHLGWFVIYLGTFIVVITVSYLVITAIEKITKGTNVERVIKHIGF